MLFRLALFLFVTLWAWGVDTTRVITSNTFDYDTNARISNDLFALFGHHGMGMRFDYAMGNGAIDTLQNDGTSLSIEKQLTLYNLDYTFALSPSSAHAIGVHIVDPYGTTVFYASHWVFWDEALQLALTFYSTPDISTHVATDASTSKSTIAIDTRSIAQRNGVYANANLWGYSLGYLQDNALLQLLVGHVWSSQVGDITLSLRYNDIFAISSYDVLAIYDYINWSGFRLYSHNSYNTLKGNKHLAEVWAGGFVLGYSYLAEVDMHGFFVGVGYFYDQSQTFYSSAFGNVRYEVKVGYSQNYLSTLERFPIYDAQIYTFSFNIMEFE